MVKTFVTLFAGFHRKVALVEFVPVLKSAFPARATFVWVDELNGDGKV
jgi:hypothetical protein